MAAEILSYGNTAKLYCLNWLDDFLREKKDPVSILDLGCGGGLNFVPLLKKYPFVHYVGVEPLARDVVTAPKNMKGLNAEIIHGQAHEVKVSPCDIVVSFSVLEHVYDRFEYLSVIKRNMKPRGHCLINYDSGHFVVTSGRWWDPRSDVWLNFLSPILGKFGWRKHYQSFVFEREFRDLVKKLGLSIWDEKFFNTDVKSLCSTIPSENKIDFMLRWLEFELFLNLAGIEYEDRLGKHFRSRNFILQHSE